MKEEKSLYLSCFCILAKIAVYKQQKLSISVLKKDYLNL
jgi:hypothetical protein